MKRLLPLTLALMISGACVLATAYFRQFYYTRYRSAVSVLDEARLQLESFNVRLAKLEAHKAQELKPVHCWGLISTADHPLDEHTRATHAPANRTNDVYYAVGGKMNTIEPEIRLPVGSTTNSEFEIQVPAYFGVVADAWISHGEPYQDLAAFDLFHVYCPKPTNVARLIARTRPGASVKMRFDVVVLCEARLPD